MAKRIYLAGPQVFLENPEPYFQAKKELCAKYDLEGVAPFDSEIEYGYRPLIERGLFFSTNNEKIMSSCVGIIADITPFRGVSADVGTAYEIGFMRAQKKLIYCYSNVKKNFYQRNIAAHGMNNEKEVDKFGMKFENFGMVDNLMIHGSVIYSGGATFVGDAPEGELFTYLGIFEKLLAFNQKLGQ